MSHPTDPSNDNARLMAKILDVMEVKATEMGIQGVAVIGLYEQGKSLDSRMKVAGAMRNDEANYMAFAYSKLAEMCDTLQDSGSKIRPPLLGEFGYVGGAIKPHGQLFYLAAFSGASGEQDLVVAQAGLALV